MDIKDLIRTKRIEKGYTMKELADLVDVSEATISRWESGEVSNMKRAGILKLSKALGVTPSAIVGLEESETTNAHKNNIESVQNEKDIAKTMEFLKSQLINEKGLMFDGELLDDETIQLVLEEIERQERLIKTINRKYTPKKYR